MACQADIVLLQLGQFLLQVEAQEAPQGFHFMPRTLPVFNREGVQGEDLDSQPGTRFHGGADGADAGFVARYPRQAPPAGPAPVSVHDDRDVCRQAGGIDRLGQIPVLLPWLERFQ